MKNYYEVLEVDVKASKEIIDKAFKVLAKRYHPDTQDDNKKAWAESKFKELNEAYEVLSNEDKRKEYDTELEYAKNSELESLIMQNENLKRLVDQLKQELQYKEIYQNNPNNININPNYSNEYQEPSQKIYYTYSEPTKHIGKDFIAFIITLILIISIGFILWNIPFTKNYFINLYENNAPLKTLFNTVFNIF